jgi:hypothetical protein
MPPRVTDHYRYWQSPPPQLSDRCLAWADRFRRGWRPSRRFRRDAYANKVYYLGVYFWEWLHYLSPLLDELTAADRLPTSSPTPVDTATVFV